MSEEVYKQTCEAMAKRGGLYPGMDIPEFYPMVEALFTPEEATVNNVMPKGRFTVDKIANELDRSETDVGKVLETMADKGLCFSFENEGTRFYAAALFVPGIMEFQFMRGTTTDKDKALAKLIYDYKMAVDTLRGAMEIKYPAARVLTVDEWITPGNTVQTYQEVSKYIDEFETISVSTCFCRQEAKLIDEKDQCGKPNEVCLQFNIGAKFIIERNLGREISKDEARNILKTASEAGLVHVADNKQKVDFLCNCCSCHCMVLKPALAQPKPGLAIYSGFQPFFDSEYCDNCDTCIDICPADALSANEDALPGLDLDLCFGCGVCACNCPSEAILMEDRPDVAGTPVDRRAMLAEIAKAHS